jgi:CheY-like chemotaxis protein
VARIVLFADDSPTIQKKALGILKGQGFEVETVSNGVAAIKRLAVIHPSVVLADVSMPGRDGYEVCEFVKKSPEHYLVPVLLVASDMEPYDDARGAQVGANGIIKKPFEAQDLINIVVKFAEEFEAATAAAAAPVIELPAPPEPPKEYAFSGEEPDQMPTVVQPVTPDFTAASEGVAFAEPTEEPLGYSYSPSPAEIEGSFPPPQVEGAAIPEPTAPSDYYIDTFPAPEPQSASIEEPPLVVEEPPAPSPFAPPPPPPEAQEPATFEGSEAAPPAPPAQEPAILEGSEAPPPEPVFIEDRWEQAPEPPSSSDVIRTMIFRAPVEIAEPVWKDETAPAPPEGESAGPAAPGLQPEPQAPAATPEAPPARLPEPPYVPPSLTVTSLDSFSLDDATAGQVQFESNGVDSPPAEVVQAEVAPEEIAPVETAQSASVIEDVPATEVAPPDVVQEASVAEVAPVEAATVEVAQTEVAPEEASPVEMAQPEPVIEGSPAAEVAPSESALEAPVPEVAPGEVAPGEAIQSEPVIEEAPIAEVIPFEAAPEVAAAGVALTAVAAAEVNTEATPAEAPPLEGPSEIAPEAQQEAAPTEPLVEPAPPLPDYEWGLVYTVVHKAVVRMSPPVLPAEIVEELARRLAEEIASEIANEASPPQE